MVLEQVASTSTKVKVLASGVKGILESIDSVCRFHLPPRFHAENLLQRSVDQLPDMFADPSTLPRNFSQTEPAPKALTNRERLEIIRELEKQPAAHGDIWFFIPSSWLGDWKRHCEQRPDDVDADFGCLDTSSVRSSSIYPHTRMINVLDHQLVDGSKSIMIISHLTWSRLSDW